MKFIAGKEPGTTQRLLALTVDKGHDPNGVRATNRDGYLVEDDVAAAFINGEEGSLQVSYTADAQDPFRIIFDCVPFNIQTHWDFGDGTTDVQNDGHTVHYYASAGTYQASVASPGRTDWQGPVTVIAARQAEEKRPRRKKDQEANDG